MPPSFSPDSRALRGLCWHRPPGPGGWQPSPRGSDPGAPGSPCWTRREGPAGMLRCGGGPREERARDALQRGTELGCKPGFPRHVLTQPLTKTPIVLSR